MNKIVLLVVWILIWFYAGLTYVWMTQQNRIEKNISIIADQLQIDIIDFD